MQRINHDLLQMVAHASYVEPPLDEGAFLFFSISNLYLLTLIMGDASGA